MEKVINFLKMIWVHLLAICFVVLSTQIINAQEMSVIQVKRNITLADDEHVFKDYYINAGDNSALRKNMVVTVKRKITIKDNGSKAVGDFETSVGQLKIIHIGNKVSVAREFKLTPRDEEPMLEQVGIMMGDRIDLTNSFIDYSKPKIKRPVSDASSESKTPSSASPQTADLAAPVLPTDRQPSNTTAPLTTEAAVSLNTPPTTTTAPIEQPLPAQKDVPVKVQDL